MLYYVPLESYKERYTFQLSAPKTGWLERNWIKAAIPYVRINGDPQLDTGIKAGVVLDAARRSNYAFSQVRQLLALAYDKTLTSDDVIYFDDFWHPGIEALPYAFDLLNMQPRMFAFLWAQSVDVYDFTYPMRGWMRDFEKGIAQILDKVFVCCDYLRDLVREGITQKVETVGHPFNSEEVKERMPSLPSYRLDHVVFSSRWDTEKRPQFFLDVIESVLAIRPLTRFIICTGSKNIRSNDQRLIDALFDAIRRHPSNIILLSDLTKEQYYAQLIAAKIQFNCADQDFVPFTLLESSVAGCYPIYPNYRSFPETFLGNTKYLYRRGDVAEASAKIINVLNRNDLWKTEAIQARQFHKWHDLSWVRMLETMGYANLLRLELKEKASKPYDPYIS